jgi:uncharacterized protein DUF5069
MPSPLINVPDLTQRPPRSPRCRLGGLVILPRMLDKGRATAVGKQGENQYNCPLDQRLLNFISADPDALMSEIKLAKPKAMVNYYNGSWRMPITRLPRGTSNSGTLTLLSSLEQKLGERNVFILYRCTSRSSSDWRRPVMNTRAPSSAKRLAIKNWILPKQLCYHSGVEVGLNFRNNLVAKSKDPTTTMVESHAILRRS